MKNVYRDIRDEIVASLSDAPLIATWHFSLKIDIYFVYWCPFVMTNMTQMARILIECTLVIIKPQNNLS